MFCLGAHHLMKITLERISSGKGLNQKPPAFSIMRFTVVASSTTASALRSRGSTGRSKGMPMGNPESPSARMGNLLTARTMILLLVASALNVWVILEQPSTSLMQYHVLFQKYLRLAPMRVLTMQMADFGSPTAKPTLLYSSSDAIDMLPMFKTRRRLHEREMVRRYIDHTGRPRVCGGADLKSSQAYPRGCLYI